MNASGDSGDGGVSESLYRLLLLPSYIVSLCVSLVALLSLVFTLWIFARRRDATAGARGMVLLIVTGLLTAFALTVLYVSSICSLASAPANGTESEGSAAASAMELFADAQYIVTNASLLLRNWWVTFLTGIRFIVILFPLHVPEILTRRRQSVAFCLILCLSTAISIVRHVEEKACSEGVNTTETAPEQSPSSSLKACERFILFFFVMQTGIPVPAVLVLSVALAVHLCAAREPSDQTTSASNNVRRSDSTVSSNVVSTTSAAAAAWRQQHHLQPLAAHQASSAATKNRGRGRKRKATRILLVLAITFTVLELPTFVYFIMLHFFPAVRSASQVKGQLIFSGFNALITLDTLANFFIFFVFSDSFKREVKSFARRALRRLQCRRCGGSKRHRLGGFGTGGGRCGGWDSNGVDGGGAMAGGLSSPPPTPELYPLREDLRAPTAMPRGEERHPGLD